MPTSVFNSDSRGDRSQAANDFWTDDFDLSLEIATAIGDFVGQWIAIIGRPAFQHVENVNLLTLELAGGNHLVEQLSAAADERFALPVFIGPRRLAEEADARGGLPTPNTVCVRFCTSTGHRVQDDFAANHVQRGGTLVGRNDRCGRRRSNSDREAIPLTGAFAATRLGWLRSGSSLA